MSVGNALLIGELVTSLTVQAVAAKTMFIAPNGIRPSTRFVGSCFVTCGLTQALVLSRIAISTGDAAIGSLLYICGLGLFVATCRANSPSLLSVAFSEDVPQHLVVWGLTSTYGILIMLRTASHGSQGPPQVETQLWRVRFYSCSPCICGRHGSRKENF